MKLIIASAVDEASMNIRRELLKDFEESDGYFVHKDTESVALMDIKDMHIYHDNVDKEFEELSGIKPELVVFISKHSSERAIETITVHPVGNYDKASLGGKDFCVVQSEPYYMTNTLRNMLATGFRASFECTHHGPYLESPTFFAEIGSDEEAWNDKEKAKAVAGSLLRALLSERRERMEAIAIGGGHYMPAPTALASRKSISFGHMVPNYHMNNCRRAIEIILEKEDVRYAYMDKKAVKKNFDLYDIRKILHDFGIEEIESKKVP
ncbi:MAG: D-aminoacyl-tRNA deacylase [Candidatus Thermoplasmatota archaeon]|nr:D-aminoacyl-tRNA deacylase [Candidatus Thermoplasmatota archaeon]